MVLLQGREQVELEGDARVARRHQPVRDELSVRRAAEMAIEANSRAHWRWLERDQARRDVRRVRAADGVMARDPARSRAVAGFAADAVRYLEARPALAGGR